MSTKPLTTTEIDAEGWQPWIDLLLDNSRPILGPILDVILLAGSPKLRRLVATALSVAKWHPYNRLRGLTGCGLCYLCGVLGRLPQCKEEGCPLFILYGRCTGSNTRNKWWAAAQQFSVSGRTTGEHSDALYRQLLEAYAMVYEEARSEIEAVEWVGRGGVE